MVGLKNVKGCYCGSHQGNQSQDKRDKEKPEVKISSLSRYADDSSASQDGQGLGPQMSAVV